MYILDSLNRYDTHTQSYIFVKFYISPKIDPKIPIKNPIILFSGKILEVCLLLGLKPQGYSSVFLGAPNQ